MDNSMRNRKEIVEIAYHYGLNSQLDMLQEECAELIQAVSKYKRNGIPKIDSFGSVVEEIADVEIMIDQIKVLLKIPQYHIDLIRHDKLDRQLNRIKGEAENDK